MNLRTRQTVSATVLSIFGALLLALVCLSAAPEVFVQATTPASDDVVIVGNAAQPFMPNKRGTIQEAINKAGALGVVIVPAAYKGLEVLTDLSNPNNILIIDLRGGTFKTSPALSGVGGNGCIGGSDTWVQFNDRGSCGGDARLRLDKNTGTFFVPDGTSISPTGIVNPNNALTALEGNFGTNHVSGFTTATVNGRLLFQGLGRASLSLDGSTGPLGISGVAVLRALDGSSHSVGLTLNSFATVSDQLGYSFANKFFTIDANSGGGNCKRRRSGWDLLR
jgi:hypothetical protein